MPGADGLAVDRNRRYSVYRHGGRNGQRSVARRFSRNGIGGGGARADGDCVARRAVAPLIIHGPTSGQGRGLSGANALAGYAYDWRRGCHRATARKIEVNDVLHGLLAQRAMARVILRFPNVVPTGTIIWVAARWDAAAKKGVAVRHELGIIGRKNGFVVRQAVTDQFGGLQVFGLDARFEGCRVLRMHTPEMDERAHIRACGL